MTPQVIFTPHHQAHNPAGGNPDTPERAERLLQAAVACGLAAHEPTDHGMEPIAAVHSPGLLALLQTAYRRFAQLKEGPRPAVPDCFAVRQLAERGLSGGAPRNIWGELGYYCSDDLTPILEQTWTAAYWSAQVAVSAAAALLDGAPLAYALCRPPGHHAYRDLYGGYCYLNNAAVAAEWLTGRGRKPAILDIDYHHGNGTQAIFYERDDVFFCSLHADPDMEYPYYCGYAHETGCGSGEGYTLNLPLPPDAGEAAYVKALERAATSIDAFSPDIVLLSLGFDTLRGDPQGSMDLQPEDFQTIGRLVAAISRPVLLVQEGGYQPSMLAPALTALLQGMGG